jgi:hypothetical protein
MRAVPRKELDQAVTLLLTAARERGRAFSPPSSAASTSPLVTMPRGPLGLTASAGSPAERSRDAAAGPMREFTSWCSYSPPPLPPPPLPPPSAPARARHARRCEQRSCGVRA